MAYAYLTSYHIATYLLLIFSVAHTIGGLYLPHDFGGPGDAVLAAMKTTYFDFNGSPCTFHGFYLGFGLMVTVFLLFSALVTWTLADAKAMMKSSSSRKGKEGEGAVLKRVLRPIAWGLFVAHLGNVVLSWRYFFAGPGVFSTLIAGLLGWECWSTFGLS